MSRRNRDQLRHDNKRNTQSAQSSRPIRPKRREYEKRDIDTLKPGDILFTFALFEENTPDYYNGHDPKDIRGHWYRNRRGEDGKHRPILYMSRDGDNLMYLPITSSRSSHSKDVFHQYQLKDNRMIDDSGQYPASYIEIDKINLYSSLS